MISKKEGIQIMFKVLGLLEAANEPLSLEAFKGLGIHSGFLTGLCTRQYIERVGYIQVENKEIPVYSITELGRKISKEGKWNHEHI